MRDEMWDRVVELYQQPHTGQDPEFYSAFEEELVNRRAKFKIGDRVQKATGYLWPGEVVSAFFTTENKLRYVVECTAEPAYGALHIFNEEQLEPRRRRGGNDEADDPEE